MKSRGTIILFVKAPLAGQVKTRLGVKIGMGRAAALFRIMTKRTLHEACKGPWETILAVDPPSAQRGFENLWSPNTRRMPQVSGDLGARMDKMMQCLPPGPVVLIGCDSPDVSASHIAAAFKALGNHEAVFGPAEDGGYWLVGLKRRPHVRKIFGNVRWSTEHTLADTQANLVGARVALLETLTDIDTGADFARWKAAHGTDNGN